MTAFHRDMAQPDPRIPFPPTPSPTPCRATPDLFSQDTPGNLDPEQAAQAKQACRGCPIAEGCLKWALANPHLTRGGVWAATTPRERIRLGRRLAERLGDDWIEVVAARDSARARRREAPRPAGPVAPATAAAAPLAPTEPPDPAPAKLREEELARLELELIPHRPPAPPPQPKGINPHQAATNRAALLAALKAA
ncbi:WhiB family transcriptional regulator [Streptomyces mayteni]